MTDTNYNELLRHQLDEAGVEISDLPAPVAMLLSSVAKSYARMQTEQAENQKTIKLRTDQLIASVSQAYSFLDSLHMGLVMCDINPEVVLTNSAMRGMLNGQSGKKSAWTLAEMELALGPKQPLREQVQKCLEQGTTMELREVPCGELVLRMLIAPMANQVNGAQQQFGAIILAEDITEQVVMMRSKDEFFFIASHELRTPLTAIRGNSSLIITKRDKLKATEVAEMMQDIHDSSVRLIEIVNDFLDVSALEQGKIEMRPANFKLGQVVDEVLRDLGSVAGAKGDRLVADPSLASLPAVTADEQRIKQVIYNLVGNAIKFTDRGQVIVSGKAEGQMVRCFVKDTGLGMSDDSHRLLFRKFQQAGTSLLTRDATKGTGLGLYISKLIVELSGGSIKLEESKPGEGSTFSFLLPATVLGLNNN